MTNEDGLTPVVDLYTTTRQTVTLSLSDEIYAYYSAIAESSGSTFEAELSIAFDRRYGTRP